MLIWQNAMTASPDCNCTVCMRVECMCAPVIVARIVRTCAVTACCQNNITYHILGVCHRLWRTLKVWYVMWIWQNAMTVSPDCDCNSHRRKHKTFMGLETEVACIHHSHLPKVKRYCCIPSFRLKVRASASGSLTVSVCSTSFHTITQQAAAGFFRQLPALQRDGTSRCTPPSVSALRCCLSHLRPLFFAKC